MGMSENPFDVTGPLQLEIQELESMETPDWITVGGLAAGTLISLAAVGFAVMT